MKREITAIGNQPDGVALSVAVSDGSHDAPDLESLMARSRRGHQRFGLVKWASSAVSQLRNRGTVERAVSWARTLLKIRT